MFFCCEMMIHLDGKLITQALALSGKPSVTDAGLTSNYRGAVNHIR